MNHLKTPIERVQRVHALALEAHGAVDVMLAAISRGDEEVAIGEGFELIRLVVEAANLASVSPQPVDDLSPAERSSKSAEFVERFFDGGSRA